MMQTTESKCNKKKATNATFLLKVTFVLLIRFPEAISSLRYFLRSKIIFKVYYLLILAVFVPQKYMLHYHPNVSLLQYSCRFFLIHFITTEYSICSFQRIFFKKAFHQILRVASTASIVLTFNGAHFLKHLF